MLNNQLEQENGKLHEDEPTNIAAIEELRTVRLGFSHSSLASTDGLFSLLIAHRKPTPSSSRCSLSTKPVWRIETARRSISSLLSFARA